MSVVRKLSRRHDVAIVLVLEEGRDMPAVQGQDCASTLSSILRLYGLQVDKIVVGSLNLVDLLQDFPATVQNLVLPSYLLQWGEYWLHGLQVLLNVVDAADVVHHIDSEEGKPHDALSAFLSSARVGPVDQSQIQHLAATLQSSFQSWWQACGGDGFFLWQGKFVIKYMSFALSRMNPNKAFFFFSDHHFDLQPSFEPADKLQLSHTDLRFSAVGLVAKGEGDDRQIPPDQLLSFGNYLHAKVPGLLVHFDDSQLPTSLHLRVPLTNAEAAELTVVSGKWGDLWENATLFLIAWFSLSTLFPYPFFLRVDLLFLQHCVCAATLDAGGSPVIDWAALDADEFAAATLLRNHLERKRAGVVPGLNFLQLLFENHGFVLAEEDARLLYQSASKDVTAANVLGCWRHFAASVKDPNVASAVFSALHILHVDGMTLNSLCAALHHRGDAADAEGLDCWNEVRFVDRGVLFYGNVVCVPQLTLLPSSSGQNYWAERSVAADASMVDWS